MYVDIYIYIYIIVHTYMHYSMVFKHNGISLYLFSSSLIALCTIHYEFIYKYVSF